jgi:N-methylhydantoinase B
LGFTADAKDVYEEGLGLPIMKLVKEGVMNEELVDIIKENVRMPKEVLGDIAAQISSQELAAAKLSEFMDSYNLDSLDPLAKIIMDKSETALREAIRKLPDGEYKNDLYLDGHIDPIKISVTATIAEDEIRVDYSGTSPMVKNRGINVPLNYTHAYTTYAVSMLVNPDIPSNDGSFRPLKVSAPVGTVVNAPPPAPVQARHIIGHQCVLAVISAFEAAIPQRTIGDSGGFWLPQWYGKTDSGETFIINYFSNGGMGARSTKDGISAFSFPTNVKNSPVEVFENLSPLVFEEKSLIKDSGGAGTMRGGLGQRISVRYTGKEPILISNLIERTIYPCKGRQNGADGATGKIFVKQLKGETLTPARNSKTEIPPDTSFIMELPGGGGYGPSANREPEAVLKDVVQEYVSAEKATEIYKVVVIKDGNSFIIDWDKTNALRS